MNPMQEYLFAMQLVNLSKEGDIAVNTYQYNNKKLESSGHTLYEAVNYILDTGLNPFMVFGNKHFNPDHYYLLIEEIFETKMAYQIVPLMMEKLTEEQVENVPSKKLEGVVKTLLEKNMKKELEVLFQKGYKLEQGSDDRALEIYAALEGYTYLFELLNEYQPEFDFEKKYNVSVLKNEKMQIIDIVKEDIDSLSPNAKSPLMDTYMFLHNLSKIKSFDKLSETLEDKDNNKNKVKL